ncbi:MAG: SMC-Scp complex subunit ScpB [Lachnospiraceae bacterium]|nr:SMC-Scp complex subunit ScpB [Lachnospiraceae bacterium]MBR3762895.1 SMC-Scp complex subunit ScpB [Lachnospiraceae bacterium]
MDKKQAKAIIEAILFTMGESVEISRLSEVIEADKKDTLEILNEMQQEYFEREGGIQMLILDKSVQLCTRKELYEYIIRIAKAPRKITLSESALETLAIVAYKQPITRVEIERIRGVSSHHSIDRLLEYDFIQELGRLDAPGRPILFGTTEQFLRSFGLETLAQMPEMDMDKMEEFKEEAEREAGLPTGVQLSLEI